MCLITPQQEPFIAKKDLVSYKLLRPDLSPIFYTLGTAYKLGELCETQILETKNYFPFDTIDSNWVREYAGIASLVCDDEWDKKCRKKKLKSFGQGFHSFTNMEHSGGVRIGEVLVECIIPKGSLYYENPVGLVISNKIIIKKVIKRNK